MVNRVILLGRVGKSPEVKVTSTGSQVSRFSLATTDSWKDKNGAKQTRTEWIPIDAWGRVGEICAQYLTKGMLVYAEGRLSSRTWEGKDGGIRKSTSVIIDTVRMVGPGKPKEEPPEEFPPMAGVPDEEDLPF